MNIYVHSVPSSFRFNLLILFVCADSQPVALTQLVSLYVSRNYALWKVPEVLKWLETNVGAVLQRVDNQDPLVKEYQAK